MFELVIFDCDGVLIDSERIAVKVDAEILREVGWQLTEAEIIQIVDLMTAKVDQRMKDRDMGLEFTPTAKSLLAVKDGDLVWVKASRVEPQAEREAVVA